MNLGIILLAACVLFLITLWGGFLILNWIQSNARLARDPYHDYRDDL